MKEGGLGLGVQCGWSCDPHKICQDIAVAWDSDFVDHRSAHHFLDVLGGLSADTTKHLQDEGFDMKNIREPASKRRKAKADKNEWH